VVLIQVPVASQRINFAVKSIMPLKKPASDRDTFHNQKKKALRASETIEQWETKLETV